MANREKTSREKTNRERASRERKMIVVGGGLIGLTIALELQKAGIDTLLLEKEQVGRGASWGNAGHIATEQVYPIADPSMLKSLPKMLLDPLGPLRIDWRYLPQLMPWGMKLLSNMRSAPFERIHQSLRVLNRAALPSWERFKERWALQSWVKIEGSLLVAEREQSLEQLQKHGEKLNALGIKNQLLERQALLDKAPALADSQLGALLFPDTGHIVDLSALIDHLLTQFQQLGGSMIENYEVDSIKKLSSKKVEVVANGELFTAESIVLATGAFSKPFAKALSGFNLPLETERGYHLMLPHEKERLSIPISSIDRKFIMTPMNSGLRLAGTVEYGGLKLPPDMRRAQNFLPLATPMLKDPLNATDATEWMGFRPTMADSLPVIDQVDNCYYAFGHQHLGITHATLTAEIITALYLNQPPPIDVKPFAIDRF
ncbi:FAD-binding oxidoreductase [Ignatzschineria sp. F8392]|uniref:NAD(P)/FAD-dependent oxidoreductase n=1 Tax=Ignatzschineria sp. F8392 TaxID=1980117 RepID=UPI001E393BD0|nr:FAD-dependent oxidoreductase [Ignatzschineria sp. F8392]